MDVPPLEGPASGPGDDLLPEGMAPFRQQLEGQRLRSLKRYLDYEARVHSGRGLEELHQWLAQILFDRSGAYGLSDRALAFEVGACEALARTWPEEGGQEAAVVVAGPLDRLELYRQLLARGQGSARRATFLSLLRSRYRRHWTWIRSRASVPGPIEGPATDGFARFLARLDDLEPLDGDAGSSRPRVAELEAELDRARAETDRLRQYLEAARDRAESALARLKETEAEARGLRRSLRAEAEGAEKLRSERSRRIKSERGSADLARELERVKAECLKLDRRLRELAGRGSGNRGPAVRGGYDLRRLQHLAPAEVLGVAEGAAAEELSLARRRFAAAFHSDRAGQLPPWVRELFDQLLGMVNDACDQLERP